MTSRTSRISRILPATAVVTCAALTATAGPVQTIEFTIQGTTTVDNFRFSLFHKANARTGVDQNADGFGDRNGASGSGSTVAFTGTFLAAYDQTAGTLTFTSFNGSVGGQSIVLDTTGSNTLNITSGNLVQGAGASGPRSGEAATAGLALTVAPGSAQESSFQFYFDDFAWNTLANRFFDSSDFPDAATDTPDDQFGLGLWGLASNDSVSGNALHFGGFDYVGLDLFATGRLIPLPHPASLTALGLLGLVTVRRRR